MGARIFKGNNWVWHFLQKKGGDNELLAYTGSDYAGDLDDRKSTSGYVFLLCSTVVSWSSKKQPIVSLSTTKTEFISATSCACQAIWLKRVLEKLCGMQNQATTVIYCDSRSVIELSKNPVMHGRCKHIDVWFHFLRNLTKTGFVNMMHCGTQEQIADIMTKPLNLDTFLKLRKSLGVCAKSSINWYNIEFKGEFVNKLYSGPTWLRTVGFWISPAYY